MFTQINHYNKRYILLFALLLLGNMRTAFATDTSRSNDHDDLQMLQNYSLNYTKEFDGLAYFKAFRSNESVWENAPGGSSEYEIILTAVKNGIQSRLYIDSEANSPSQTMSIKIRRIAKLDNNNFWVEFESQTSSYRELYDDSNFIVEYYDVDTTWFASILAFDNVNKSQLSVHKIPIMQQQSFVNYSDKRDNQYMEKHQINVIYSKGKINIKKRTKEITKEQEKWLGRRTLK